ncbi:MAG: CRISPR-associated endonuclease Cas2 [Bryobacteraceae bacterium]|nr:CRISPR-associated endonuclease Cas2 [Bryobacteraceae bacterium]
MSFGDARGWLVCYDVADPRRLGRVHRFWKREAIAVQYSVFLAVGRRASIERAVAASLRYIKTTEDDIRVYPLPERGFATGVGAALHYSATRIYGQGLGLLRTLSQEGFRETTLRERKSGEE